MKVPKTEITTTSCCSVPDQGLLVPKTEITSNSCRSPPTNMRSAYEPYMNHDSNSSSMSSMDAMNSRGPQHQVHHLGPHHNSQPGYTMEHQMPHRSPYQQSPMSEEMYHRERSYTDMNDSMSGGIARPIVTYSSDMANRPYDSSIVNSSSHRPYDPGTGGFERYDSGQCVSLQQPLGPPRVPPQGMYGYSMEDQQEQRYQQEATAAQHHQLAIANATQGLIKSEEQENTGPLYPRYVTELIIWMSHCFSHNENNSNEWIFPNMDVLLFSFHQADVPIRRERRSIAVGVFRNQLVGEMCDNPGPNER